ncbi:MAG: DEAD/DEAH box helicase [Sumerlaeia bacterium]
MSASAFSLLDPKLQKVIYDKKWDKLHPVQVRAIQAILETGRHVVISAPTAGGKTEAAFLPILTAIAKEPQPSVQCLCVSPLKALINDQFARLEEWCEALAIPVHRWHGDVSGAQKRKLRGNPGGVLIITPESLESNLVNFGKLAPKIYAHLQFVVIDELHAFLDNVRGMHLRSLVARISAAAGVKPRFVGLSATLSDQDIPRRFLRPDDPGSVDFIAPDGSEGDNIRLKIRAVLARTRESVEKENAFGGLGGIRIEADMVELLFGSLGLKPGDWDCLGRKLENAIRKRGVERSLSLRDHLDDLADLIATRLSKGKNLAFVNAKSILEQIADRIVQRQGDAHSGLRLVVHHGSLSKDVREETEAKLKKDDGRPLVCLCSSTLEMGIDIGDIRTVGQIGAPWSVASLRQRIGRSGRKTGEPRLELFTLDTSPSPTANIADFLYPDLLRAIAMVELMGEKWFEPPDIDRHHLSTLVHQTMSCLKQTGGMPIPQVYAALCQGEGPFRRIATRQFARLLRGLAAKEIVEQTPDGLLILGLMGERLTASYEFYAAFQAPEEYTIQTEHERIGKLPASLIPPVGECFTLSARRWCVTHIDEIAKTVLVKRSPGGSAPMFHASGGDIHTVVRRRMRGLLLESGELSYIDATALALLRSARRVFLESGLADCDVQFAREKVLWLPWTGTRTMRTLALYAQHSGLKQAHGDELSLTLPLAGKEAFLEWLQPLARGDIDPLELAQKMVPKTAEKYDTFIPADLLDEANATDRLDIVEAQQIAREAIDLLAST